MIDNFKTRGVWFTATTAESTGRNIITNHHNVMNEASLHRSNIISIPLTWSSYQGLDEYKRKHRKQKQVCSRDLSSHSQALYAICMKPIMETSSTLQVLHDDIYTLANSLQSCAEYLNKQTEEQNKRHRSDHPARIFAENCSPVSYTASEYVLVDKAVKEAGVLKPILFEEDKHLSSPFTYCTSSCKIAARFSGVSYKDNEAAIC